MTIVTAPRSMSRSFPALPSILRCGALLVVTKLMLATCDLRHTLRLMAWLTRRIPPRSDMPLEFPEQVARRVTCAAALYPGRALCLEQSLVLYYLLRSAGIAATFRLGVRPHPFAAHAWVEYGGAPLNDESDHIRQFIPLPDLLRCRVS